MEYLRIFLLGKFCVQCDGKVLAGLEGKKVQELLCYLLVFHNTPHTREKLASILWPDSTESRSKQYLRQSLWQLQSALEEAGESGCGLISVDSDWLQVNREADCWVDIFHLEDSFKLAQGLKTHEITSSLAGTLSDAAQFYNGNLLENCYQDWCILERERFQNFYLAILDWLMDYCLFSGDYALGIDFGVQILRHDIARERTYRKLMRLHYLNNDRTGAMCLFRRCKEMIAHEFEVEPAARTLALFEKIRKGLPLDGETLTELNSFHDTADRNEQFQILKRLDHITAAMQVAFSQVTQEVEAVRMAISDHQ